MRNLVLNTLLAYSYKTLQLTKMEVIHMVTYGNSRLTKCCEYDSRTQVIEMRLLNIQPCSYVHKFEMVSLWELQIL